jgi:hypothetical protein
MIISFVMPAAPLRSSAPPRHITVHLRRPGGEVDPDHRHEAMQDEGDGQRHIVDREIRGSRLPASAAGLSGRECEAESPETF